MESLEPKKLALLRILEILKDYSDSNHPLTQEEISQHLHYKYGINIERKAISRNISLLKEAEYEIESTKAGSYISDREFEDSELRLLIDGVLSSKHITSNHSKDLINKLCGLSNHYFKSHVKNIYSVNDWNKTDNQSLFYNIEIIDDAIQEERQISFDYNKYGIDKDLHKTAEHITSPYQLILHNQRYYLMALNERWKDIGYYRMDRITNMKITDKSITPLSSVAGYEKGINYKEMSSSLPYMFNDKAELIVFLANKAIVDQIIDWFGFDTKFEKENEKIKVTIKASPNAMEYWAMQYLNFVEIISPVTLRNKIKENVENAMKKYE